MKQTIVFQIEGMSCVSCAQNVEKVLNEYSEISDVRISILNKTVSFKLTEDVDLSLLQKKVENIGCSIHLSNSSHKISNLDFIKVLKRRMMLGWAISLPLSLKMMGERFFGWYIGSENIAFTIDFILAALVIFVIGFPVLRSTYYALVRRNYNMDSLIGIGTMGAFSTGLLRLFGIEVESFVVIGALIISIHFVGNYLKEIASGHASATIKQLLELGAKQARVINKQGLMQDVPIKDLLVGQIILVEPGEAIPIDGVVIEGISAVDETIFTGESILIGKKCGDTVIGATINQFGLLKIRVDKTVDDTFLARIVRMIEDAQDSKIPVQAFADKATVFFVPAILILALLTFVFWITSPVFAIDLLEFLSYYFPWVSLDKSIFGVAVFASIATLVIACPCALGLAAPTALMVGIGKGVKAGIFFRNGETIQIAQKIDTVVLDKTGTLTTGKPQVVDYITHLDRTDFMQLAASVESLSDHPIAKSIVSYVRKKKIVPNKVDDFKIITGQGIEANINGCQVHLGNIRFFIEQQIDFGGYIMQVDAFQEMGYTVILLACDFKCVGIIAVHDTLKNDSIEAVKSLKELGIKVVMLTGDNEKSAKIIGGQVHVETIFADLKPEDKLNIIKTYQAKGNVIAMVGDGISDSEALEQADIGIAIGSGIEITNKSASITLVGESLMGVLKSINLSKATFSKIQNNLFWAFFYNVIFIPFAILGLLHPIIAEIAMALSAVTVIANSLRLKKLEL
ncbi:MAG: copper-translocating P-type ATPase [Bacteroidales bacterium]|nr:copper-translocating P-type ATPase [Bacteroidales bacterium]